MGFFKEWRDKYKEKHKNEEIPDYVSMINGRENTETPDPAKLGNHKNLMKAERERQSQWDEQ